jgi:CheY-like chemotaxis protein
MKQYNILIVDDEEGVRTTYKRMLSSEGYNLIFANDHSDALMKMEEFSVRPSAEVGDISQVLALAIIDQNLEDFHEELHDPKWATATGLNLIQEVKSLFRPSRVIMITAYKWQIGEDHSFEAGRLLADGYYAKKEILIAEPLKELVRQELQKFDQAVKNYNKKITTRNL